MSHTSIDTAILRKVRSLKTKKHPVIQVEVKPDSSNSYAIILYRIKPNTANKKEVHYTQEEKINLKDFFDICCASFFNNIKQAKVAYDKKEHDINNREAFNPLSWVLDKHHVVNDAIVININGFISSAGIPKAFLSDLQELIEQHETFSYEKKKTEAFPVSHVFSSVVSTGKSRERLDDVIKIASPLRTFFEQYYQANKQNDSRTKKSLLRQYTSQYLTTLGGSNNTYHNVAIWTFITILEDWDNSQRFYTETLQGDSTFRQKAVDSFEVIDEHEVRYLSHLYVSDISNLLPHTCDMTFTFPALLESFPEDYLKIYLLDVFSQFSDKRQAMQLKDIINLELWGFGYRNGDNQNPNAYKLIDPNYEHNIVMDMLKSVNPEDDLVIRGHFIDILSTTFKHNKTSHNNYKSHYSYTEALYAFLKMEEGLPSDHYSMALLALTGSYAAKLTATSLLSDVEPNIAGQFIRSEALIRLWMEFYNKTPIEAIQLPSITDEDKRWLVGKLK